MIEQWSQRGPGVQCIHVVSNKSEVKVKFLFIAISGFFLGIFEGSHGSQRVAPEPMSLPTMTQAEREHTTQCIRLVHADALCIAPQRGAFH